MTYDPRTGTAENLGLPFPKEGVIDVVADESRGLLYVVTCEEQHWMRYDTKTRSYRELGPLLTPYATTLVTAEGRANTITADFQMAQYDPATDKVTTDQLLIDGTPLRDVLPKEVVHPDCEHDFPNEMRERAYKLFEEVLK